MASNARTVAADHPALDPVVRAALRSRGLDASWEDVIVQLATGALPPGHLRCCGTGCKPCVRKLESCARLVVGACADPEFGRELIASQTARARALAAARRFAASFRRRRM
jgi:hypothetical protein